VATSLMLISLNYTKHIPARQGATPKPVESPTELETLEHQQASGFGIFGCDAFKVFSDKMVALGGLLPAAALINPDFKKYSRKGKPACFLRTPLSLETWKHAKSDNKCSLYLWSVTADVSTVFVPAAIIVRLSVYPATATGVYLETCNKVLQGFFGSLEVVSKTVMKRFWELAETHYANGGQCWRWTGLARRSGTLVLARTYICRRARRILNSEGVGLSSELHWHLPWQVSQGQSSRTGYMFLVVRTQASRNS